MDGTTLEDLSVSSGLLPFMTRTKTRFGARCLQRWLQCPLADAGAINDRLDAVTCLRDGTVPRVVTALLAVMSTPSFPDVDKGLARLEAGGAPPVLGTSRERGIRPVRCLPPSNSCC